MKIARHKKILELIRDNEVTTQEELASLLIDSNYIVTQATVSRDIRELGLTKMAINGGTSKYVAIENNEKTINDKLLEILKAGFVSMDFAQNILVVKTVSGMAMAVAAALDALKWDEIVGDTRLEIQSDEDLETLRDFKSGIMVVTVNKDNWEDFISSAEDNNGDFGMYMSSATMGGKTENYKNILVYSGKHYYYESNQPVVDAETGEIIPQYPTQRYVQYFIDDNIIYKRVIELAENSDAFGSYVSFEKIEGVTKEYVDDMVGDIETALDNIIVIQNELIGGDNK